MSRSTKLNIIIFAVAAVVGFVFSFLVAWRCQYRQPAMEPLTSILGTVDEIDIKVKEQLHIIETDHERTIVDIQDEAVVEACGLSREQDALGAMLLLESEEPTP